MANREEIRAIVGYMKLTFPNYNPDVSSTPNVIDVLLDLLGDMPTETLQVAVKTCCAEPGRAFAPSAGEIRGAVATLHAQAAGTPSAGEAWAAIIESFHHTSFHQPELLKHPMVAESIRQMGGMELIGASDNIMAERAHFLKIYNSLYDREMTESAQLPAVTEYVESRRLESGIKLLTERLEAK